LLSFKCAQTIAVVHHSSSIAEVIAASSAIMRFGAGGRELPHGADGFRVIPGFAWLLKA
jgi:hypothetical protein